MMEFRNPVFNALGTIDCEVNHPVYGWIPFTAGPDDPASEDIYEAAAVTAGPYVPPPPAALTAVDVDAERDRRILSGASFTVTGYANPIRLAGDPVTRANLADVAVMAQVQIAAGNGTATLVWRDEDNTDHTLTFVQVLELFGLGFAFFNAVWTAAWPLKDADPIPADYTDDSYWP